MDGRPVDARPVSDVLARRAHAPVAVRGIGQGEKHQQVAALDLGVRPDMREVADYGGAFHGVAWKRRSALAVCGVIVAEDGICRMPSLVDRTRR